ncbi:hypothetical protein R6Q57_021299, partial [Mikania cordata]
CDCKTGSSKPVPLTADPVKTDPNISDNSDVCVDSLNDRGLRGKNEERSAGRNTECSTSFRTPPFIPKTEFVEYKGRSTITKEAGSKLNPNCEPFVPTGSLEQASANVSSGHGSDVALPLVRKPKLAAHG